MMPIDAYALIAAEVKDASPEQITEMIEQRFGVRINPKYVPLYRAFQRVSKEQAAETKADFS